MRGSRNHTGPVREPVVEGIFYPEKREELSDLVSSLISRSSAVPAAAPAIVTPHASLSYSGETMSAAFKRAAGQEHSSVVLIGPVHRDEEPLLIFPESRAFRTPLGTCEVDEALCSELLESTETAVQDDIPHLEEHCIEIQLPFVQYLFPKARILPILMGSTTESTVCALRDTIRHAAERLGDRGLVVVSSNMTGYREAQRAKDEASRLVQHVVNGDWRSVLADHGAGQLSTRGVGCIAALLAYAENRLDSELLARQNSFPQNPDVQRVVEYASFAFFTSP